MASNTRAQIFQKSRSDLKILGARELPLSMFYSEDALISSATIQNSFARVIWYLGFVYICLNVFSTLVHNKCE